MSGGGSSARHGTSSRDAWAIVLAGGDGKRLQDLTRTIAGAPIPKQYCRIDGVRSMLEATLLRVGQKIPAERTLVIVNRDHLALATAQLGDVPSENVIVQPTNRDTGPGLGLTLLTLARRAPKAPVAIFPSDHWVSDDARFMAHVERGLDVVRALPDKIALLGVRPDRADPDHGYVLPGLRAAGMSTFHVRAFMEKPTPQRAAAIVRRGGLWNTFVMTGRVDRMVAHLRTLRPDEVAGLAAVADAPADVVDAAYRVLAPWNFSHEFLTNAVAHLLVLAVHDVAWSDWGTPGAVMRTMALLAEKPAWWGAELTASAVASSS